MSVTVGADVGPLLELGRVGRRTAGRGFSVNVTLGGSLNLGRPVDGPEDESSVLPKSFTGPGLIDLPDSMGFSEDSETGATTGREFARKGNWRRVGASPI